MVIATTIAERLGQLECDLKDARFMAEQASWASGARRRAEVARVLGEMSAVKNETDAEIELSVARDDLDVARAGGSSGTEQLDRIRALVAHLNAVKVFPMNLPRELVE